MVKTQTSQWYGGVGDLGLKSLQPTSNGDKLTIKQTQKWANKLAVAQRAKNIKKRTSHSGAAISRLTLAIR